MTCSAPTRRTATATRIVAHLRYALRRCAMKRRSLERGVEALERCSRRCAEAASIIFFQFILVH